MPANPPPYALESYWDDKYRKNQQPFDWLVPPSCLETEISDFLKSCFELKPKIAHIGCGTSLLSFNLRNVVRNPEDVHNLDFSAPALEWGQSLEDRFVRLEKEQDNQQARIETSIPKYGQKMKWIQSSLLSLDSVQSTLQTSYYSLVVDKSCSDSIACGDDVEIPATYPLITPSMKFEHVSGNGLAETRFTHDIYPLQILAIHLAYITLPGAAWIALSFSPGRFDFLTPGLCETHEEAVPSELLKQGFPDPGSLWSIERKVTVEGVEEHAGNGQVVHRPKPLHYLFTLRRTDVAVKSN
jgi:hypothetical protein